MNKAEIMKNTLKKSIAECINALRDADIYSLVLLIFPFEDEPSVMLGYNTEDYADCLGSECVDSDDGDMDGFPSKETCRWDYSYWTQTEAMIFPEDEDTSEMRSQWINEMGGIEPDMEMENSKHYDDVDRVYDAFKEMLVEIVKEIHEEKVLTKKLGRELPILIHEDEYTDEVAMLNIKANGEELVKEFVEWINQGGPCI